MPRKIEVPDLGLIDGIVAPRVIQAAHHASKALSRAGIRHVLIGGLAVGAYGYIRATKDVDFLIGDEGFEHHGSLVTKAGVPIEVDGVRIDMLADDALEDEFDGTEITEGIPIISVEGLIYLKLIAHRRRDKEDIVELLKAGIDEKPVRQFVRELNESLLLRLDDLIMLADEEE
jgi:hypothetical protein